MQLDRLGLELIRLLAKFGVLVLAFLIAGVPLMACMLPGSSLSADEQACCRDMANQCGQDQMPSSHPCCKTVGPSDHYALTKSSFDLVHEAQTLYLLLPITQVVEVSQREVASYALLAHAPPNVPAAAADILKI